MEEQSSLHRVTPKEGQKLLQKIAAYQRPGRWQSIWQLANTLVPYAVLWYLTYRAFTYSIWLALPAVVLLAGFVVRAFIIFHDCGHGSFFRSRRANDAVGILTGILTFTPYYQWRHDHAVHHATAGEINCAWFCQGELGPVCFGFPHVKITTSGDTKIL